MSSVKFAVPVVPLVNGNIFDGLVLALSPWVSNLARTGCKGANLKNGQSITPKDEMYTSEDNCTVNTTNKQDIGIQL